MTHENEKPDVRLDDAISALRGEKPEPEQLRAAGERVWSQLITNADKTASIEQIRGCEDFQALLPAYAGGKLSPSRALLVETHLRECPGCRRLAHSEKKQPGAWSAPVSMPAPRWSFRQLAMAASILFIVGLSAFMTYEWFKSPVGVRAAVQSVDGTLYRVSDNGQTALRPGDELAQGELVRTAAGSHAFVRLYDGSVVEMNERSEFSVSGRRRDTTVNLEQGRIIVQAAKRRTGHLYVVTPDARVAVTGTVFSVNSGMKGSRVSVIEGEVHVAHAGVEDVLHSGDQVATSASITAVPVRDEIAWSRNLDKHLALLAQFAKLQNKLDQIPMPGLRYSSAILTRVPADTMVYAAIPNLGDALNEANRIFQEQLQQSPELREWWNKGKHNGDGPTFEEIVDKIHTLSQYLGDEVVLVAVAGQNGESDAVLMAEVRRQGLRDFLQSEFNSLQTKKGDGEMRVVDEAQLAAVPLSKHGQLLALVRPDFVLFSSNPRSLQKIDATLNTTGGGFANTDFGQTVGNAYSRGAGFLLAVNLHQLMAQNSAKPAKNPHQHQDQTLQLTGFADARYLIAEHREVSGVQDNRAVLDFTAQRHGIASWLAEPAPMGSLEYVSANAGMAVSFVAKSPAMMMDDIMQIAAANEKDGRGLQEVESELGINLRDDFAACFGGDTTIALDGPILPTPAWKFVAQINDAARLQNTLQRLTEAINREAAKHGRPGVQIEQNNVNGRTFYVIRSLDPKTANTEFHYTFADGYMIVAPSRALIMSALRTKSNNDSLARSAQFQSLLPKDQHANFSAVFYQNLAPVVQPIASQLSPSQLQSLQEIAANAKPTLICAYGGENSIEVASASELLPINLNQMAIGALLGGHQHQPHR